MKAKQVFRVAAPVLAISALPLVVGIAAAWMVLSQQRHATKALAGDILGVEAGSNLSIQALNIRTELNQFINGNGKDPNLLQDALDKRHIVDDWIVEAGKSAERDEEKDLVKKLRDGSESFFSQLGTVLQTRPDERIPKVRDLVTTALNDGLLEPAETFKKINEQDILQSNAENLRMQEQSVFGFLLLGVCGSASGVLAGFGIARGYSRSIVRLSLPIQDAAGKLNEIVGPITFSSQAGVEEIEVVLHKIADQIGAVMKRLEASQRETLRAEQLAAVGQMAAGIAHELRNPLMAMKILVQAAGENSPPVLADRDLAVLEEEITRLERSTETFLDFARPPELERRTFDLRALINQVLDLLSERAQRQGASVRCDSADDRPIPIRADAGQICQVLLNLFLNALDVVPRGGCVWVTVEGPPAGTGINGSGGWLTLRVCDNGPGLPADLGARIFEPFVGTKPSGIGLGLSICRRIVESHGGEIRAANRPEGGAEFTVRLPMTDSAARVAEAVAAGAS
jgi:two-component system, NtrC family, sensor histidine kinase HydH